MPERTQIVCLHEGRQGRSIDEIFINCLLRELNPVWLRPWKGSNIVRLVAAGGRAELVKKMPGELKVCLGQGADTTLIVCADLDHDMQNAEQLKNVFWAAAQKAGIEREEFDRVVFAFAKDRIENWIEFLLTGATDELKEGPRQNQERVVALAARHLAKRCRSNATEPKLPDSLAWSCRNWRDLVRRMS
ncbi:MAG: hypothetical protein ACP5O1_11180 [Phycisphaerae bacterium]